MVLFESASKIDFTRLAPTPLSLNGIAGRHCIATDLYTGLPASCSAVSASRTVAELSMRRQVWVGLTMMPLTSARSAPPRSSMVAASSPVDRKHVVAGKSGYGRVDL